MPFDTLMLSVACLSTTTVALRFAPPIATANRPLALRAILTPDK